MVLPRKVRAPKCWAVLTKVHPGMFNTRMKSLQALHQVWAASGCWDPCLRLCHCDSYSGGRGGTVPLRKPEPWVLRSVGPARWRWPIGRVSGAVVPLPSLTPQDTSSTLAMTNTSLIRKQRPKGYRARHSQSLDLIKLEIVPNTGWARTGVCLEEKWLLPPALSSLDRQACRPEIERKSISFTGLNITLDGNIAWVWLEKASLHRSFLKLLFKSFVFSLAFFCVPYSVLSVSP